MMIKMRPPITQLPPKSQFPRELLSIAGLTPFPHYTSPGRQQMFTHSHMAQKITVSGMTEQYLQTGVAAEFGKYTFAITMPCDAKILKIFHRYPVQDSVDGISHNPETVVIYEDRETKIQGCLILPEYFSYHTYFGFPYAPGRDMHKLSENGLMNKGDIILDSPAKTMTGNYMYGVQLNSIFISDAANAEDGLIFRRKVLEKFKFKRYEVRSAEWGSSRFAINLCGDNMTPKICNDIGEYVRPDGLLMAFRTYDPQLAPVEQNINAVRQVDYAYDTKLYANGPGGKIVDIRITTNADWTQAGSNLDSQLLKYITAKQNFYKDILNAYTVSKHRNPSLQVSNQYHALLIKAMVETNYRNKNLSKVFRKVPIDHFRIEFVMEYEVTPSIGFKFTDQYGGKGVVCDIREDHEMPRDANGTLTDVIQSTEARTNRMNTGGLFEHYINACSYQIQRDLWSMAGIAKEDKSVELKLKSMRKNDPSRYNALWDRLIGYYRIIAPLQAYLYDSGKLGDDEKLENISNCISDFVYLHIPSDFAVDYMAVVGELDDYAKPVYQPVTFVNKAGETIVTRDPARIGSMYFMLLEKTGDDWSAVASAKEQHYGFLAQIGKGDKYTEPGRPQPIKGLGETEFRLVEAYCGAEAIAEMMDRSNSASSHREVSHSIIAADKPTAIAENINRKNTPFGSGAGIQIFTHVMNIMGMDFEYIPESKQNYEQMYIDESKYYGKTLMRTK